MAALSSRLANMGFMKRGNALKQEKGVQEAGQQPSEAAAAPHRQPHKKHKQQQEHHPAAAAAIKEEPDQQQAAAAAGGPGSHQQQQQQDQQQPKLQLSANITNMKFMQRAQLKRSREAFDEEQAAKDAAEWVVPTAVQDKGCLILHERDPLPAGVSGRMSFGFGHFHELAQAEEAERQAAAAAEAAAAAAASGAHIRDDEMAGSSFGGGGARGGSSSSKGSWSASVMRTKDSAKRTAREAKRQRR